MPALFAVYHVLLRHWTPRHPPRTLSTCSPVIRGGGYSIRRTSSRVLRCAFHLSTEQCPLYPEDICSQRVCALAASVVVNLPLASRQLQKAASQLPLPAPSTRFPPRLMALAERPAHRASLIFTCSTTTRLRLPTKQPGETPGRKNSMQSTVGLQPGTRSILLEDCHNQLQMRYPVDPLT